MFPEQIITLYHKNGETYEKYHLKASVRKSTTQTFDRSGYSSDDTVLVRVFDVTSYTFQWFVSKGDIIVNSAVNDDIKNSPLTELSEKYGKNNVFKVTSIDKFLYEDSELNDLMHIKIGAK